MIKWNRSQFFAFVLLLLSFQDLLPLQTNSIVKADLDHCISLRDRCKLVPSNIQQHFEQTPTVAVTATAAVTDTAEVTRLGTTEEAENIHGNFVYDKNSTSKFQFLQVI